MRITLKNKLLKIYLVILICLSTQYASSQNYNRYWVQFTDKVQNQILLQTPEKVLSARSLARRLKNNATFDETDLPVSSNYLDSLTKHGAKIIYTSRWFNSATIELQIDSIKSNIEKLTCVQKIEKTFDEPHLKSGKFSDKLKIEFTENLSLYNSTYYNNSFDQINLENGIPLHNSGYRGNGIQIALLDGGFLNADKYLSLKNIFSEGRVLGTHDFVNPGNDVYNTETHGAEVFSIIGANLSNSFVGTAPDASFWLLRSEYSPTEYPVEEDNWVAAAEYADSVGADIISSSLGYTEFDNPAYDHNYSDMNGKTSRASIAAEIAVSKGIVTIISAGNEGNKSWHYISSPADANGVLAIGATDNLGDKTNFSSFGPSSDGRIKPDVSAMGSQVYVETNIGEYNKGNGTSFSAPIIAGLTACLIQAFPSAKAIDIMNAVRESSNSYSSPNNSLGYGIPNFSVATSILAAISPANQSKIEIFPNPFRNYFVINVGETDSTNVTLQIFNISGQSVLSSLIKNSNFVYLSSEIESLSQGIYFIKVNINGHSTVLKAIKL